LPVLKDAHLIDLNYGQWQGLTYDDVAARWPDDWEVWRSRPDLARIPGGESLFQLAIRVVDFLTEIMGLHPEDTVVIVGHDSLNRILLLQALDVPLSRFWHLSQDPCGVNELEIRNGNFVVHSVNETYHMATSQEIARH